MSPAPLQPSEEEEQLAVQLLAITNCEAAGALSSNAAIDIFQRSGLSFELLRDIWNMADKNGSGDLSKEELVVAIRLIGWMQAGEALHDGLLAKSGPLPTLEGITDVVRQPSPALVIQTPQFPVVSAAEIRNFSMIFMRMGPFNGLLEGDKVMDAFMSSNLAYDYIWRVKKLVDTAQRGALDFREFALGMYLIHALQSCLICDVPSSIPRDLYDQFKDLKPPESEPSSSTLSQRHRPSSSLPAPTLRAYTSTPALGGRNSYASPLPNEEQKAWDISPEEKQESDSHFEKLDSERKGYIETETAAKFMLTYQLPQVELGRIWMLSDLNKDSKLTPVEFAIVMHLIKQRLAGIPVPEKLPTSLLPPSMRSTASSPSRSPTQKSKPPPPPPKKDRLSVMPNSLSRSESSAAALASPSGNSKYSTPLSPPLSPLSKRSRPSMSGAPPMSFLTNGKLPPRPPPLPTELLSPFEDPGAELHSTPSSRHHTPPPSPRPPESSNSDALEEMFKKETSRLSKQVETLLSQLTEQNRLRDSNEALRGANEELKSQMHDMERTVSEVLSANDRLGSEEQYMQEITRLNTELSAKETQCENSERMLAMLDQDQQELKTSLRESQATASKAQNETEDLRQTISTQTDDIKELRARVSDMSKAMAEPSSTTNNRELRVLLRDATKENESLKVQLRDMKKSMEEFLLSSRSPTQVDELKRENRRLKEHVHELEVIAATVQSSSSSALSGRPAASRGAENLARENDQLKIQLRDGQRVFADFRSTSETNLVELQQKIDNLTHENNRLKIESRRSQPHQEDNSIPPPAYDDSFVIPP